MFLKKTTVDGYEKWKSDLKKNHLHKNIFARWNVENDVGEHLTANQTGRALKTDKKHSFISSFLSYNQQD